ncbi:2-amino-3-ketobutyrate coenzyme A ligase [Geodia barretti]|uniref:2-amino-3-ketobutyrate coenzyme A ligase n=1 Tax=Geodia barretti TaxID=519541 RepID=A0AA35RPN3_GEOBA|nr:2-amino-3-ketobutyrate coenzyme A ligase [Geodia barretti]
MTAVPASVLKRLGVEPTTRKAFQFAQEEVRTMDVGYARVRVEDQEIITQVLFNDEGRSIDTTREGERPVQGGEVQGHPQGAEVDTSTGHELIMCANNYLGLADSEEIEQAVVEGLKTHGFGMASVRFICGTQDIHKELEDKITGWFGTEATILYTSCFDANTGCSRQCSGRRTRSSATP